MENFFRYILASILSFSVNIGLTALLHEVLETPEELAFGIALFVAMIVNFFVHRNYTFPGASRPVMIQLAVFVASTAGFRGTEYISFLMLHSLLGVNYLVSGITVIFVSFMVKFFFFRKVIFY